MTPLLIHLDGPAAYEVGRVLRAGCPGAEPVAGASSEAWWGEVREFAAPVVAIARRFNVFANGLLEALLEEGADEWLVEKVLPEPQDRYCGDTHANSPRWGCGRCDFRLHVPARLAIMWDSRLRPSPLLLARVEHWGGERWYADEDRYCIATPRGVFTGSSWLDVTRKAAA